MVELSRINELIIKVEELCSDDINISVLEALIIAERELVE